MSRKKQRYLWLSPAEWVVVVVISSLILGFVLNRLRYTTAPPYPHNLLDAMVADAAKAFGPKILYPYHYGQTDPNELVKLLKDEKKIEVRVRKMR